jgi:excisionase family DNA binding protein
MAGMQVHEASSLATTKLLNYDEAAEVLGCTPRLVRKFVETRQIDFVKVGRLVRIEPGAIERYKDAHRRVAVS